MDHTLISVIIIRGTERKPKYVCVLSKKLTGTLMIPSFSKIEFRGLKLALSMVLHTKEDRKSVV